ncbi:glycoside hydrolase domain-containing protein [Microbacterium sp. 22242]|uniref:glycoside hydrolase domain-containing protein n=1 Tax=Microbacterium sp. 22242 TaxID=3453896 RepID=UPI003F82A1C0
MHWAFYADGEDAVRTPHAALAVTVDAVFDDGSRLSEDPRVRDRYGFGLGAAAQFAARWSMPEQWNADSVSLAPWRGRTAALEVVLGAPSLHGVSGTASGFVEVVVAEGADGGREGAETPTAADRVDTRRGSHAGPRFSRGNTIPIVAVPHGFCFLTPATDAAESRWPYRWSVHDDEEGRALEALQFSHQPSPWIGDRGVLQVMPFLGAPASDHAARRMRILPGGETARPFEYRAQLREGLRVEMTATSHGGAFRVTAEDPHAVVGFVIDQLANEGRLRLSPEGAFEGWIPEGPAHGGDLGWGSAPRTFFAGCVVGSVQDAGMLADAGRDRVAGHLTGRGALEIRIAQSFLSVAQAGRNLAEELGPERGFAAIRAGLRDEWNGLLEAVELPPLPDEDRAYHGLADREAREQIASALYRLHLYPNTASEQTGSGRRFADPMTAPAPHGEERTGAPVGDGELFVNNGYWDTYRTAWPALALLDPAGTGSLLDGLLQQWRRGGWMARWSAPGYVDSMVGTSSDQIFADGERWGIPFDHAAAFGSAWRNACEPAPDPRTGRKGIARGRFAGYVSTDTHEGMSWSLENAIADAGIAHLAQRLAERSAGRDAEPAARYRALARYFRNRSLSYRQLFDAGHGFFRGRDADGSFRREHFEPRTWGGDYVETNAWGMSVSAVHDGAGVAALYGGPSGLGAHLDRLIAEPETADERFGGAYGTVIHEQREARALRSGMCAISNQPAHHIPWMYVHSDRPWLAGATVHALAERLFAGGMIGQGFPGDEDNGEMSMWWLWAALGLYPLEPASGELRIGSPLQDDIVVRRSGGSLLRIRSIRAGAGARLLVRATLNGVELERPVLPIDALAADAELELRFSADPVEAAQSRLWRRSRRVPGEHRPDLTSAQRGAPFLLRPDERMPHALPGGGVRGSGAAGIFDDGRSAQDLPLVPGAGVGWCFDAPRIVTDVTITAADPAPAGGWVWEASDDGSVWIPAPTTHAEPLLADRTTPFSFSGPVRARMLRLRALAPLSLRQLELFDLTDLDDLPIVGQGAPAGAA